MSSFPPPPPSPPPLGYAPISREDALSRVSVPAILLIVAGGLGAAWNLLSLLLNVLGIGVGTLAPRAADERFASLFSGGLGIVIATVFLALNGFLILGGIKMKALESYGLAVAAAAIALLPCCPCCFLSLPVGIWALVVLMDQGVRAAFRS